MGGCRSSYLISMSQLYDIIKTMRHSLKAKTHNFLLKSPNRDFSYLHSHSTKIPSILTHSGSVVFHQLFQINV